MELSVGDPARERAGIAIVASLAVVVIYGSLAWLSKEMHSLDIRQPWQDDPYDVPLSFNFVMLPLLVVMGALRIQLCRRLEPVPARRLVDVLRVCGVAVGLSGFTELTQWVAVALGQHSAQWTAATIWQEVALAGLSAGSIACGVLLYRARHAVTRRARIGVQPDWLADSVALSLRAARRLGPLQPMAERVVRWLDDSVVRRVRAHPVAAAAVLAVVLALPLVGAKVFLEQYPAPLAAFVFALSVAGLFPFVVITGSYLRVVAPGSSRPPAWLGATVAACSTGLAVFAFHDSLLAALPVHQTAGTLTCLLLAGGAAGGVGGLVAQTALRHIPVSACRDPVKLTLAVAAARGAAARRIGITPGRTEDLASVAEEPCGIGVKVEPAKRGPVGRPPAVGAPGAGRPGDRRHGGGAGWNQHPFGMMVVFGYCLVGIVGRFRAVFPGGRDHQFAGREGAFAGRGGQFAAQ